MNVIWLMIAFTLILVTTFVAGYIWAVRHGQFDDLVTPAHRILLEDQETETTQAHQSQKGSHS